LEVKRIDVFSEEGQKIAKSLGVMATPTTVVVKNGKVQKTFVGIVSADRILEEFKP
jgi:thioredoxin 1